MPNELAQSIFTVANLIKLFWSIPNQWRGRKSGISLSVVPPALPGQRPPPPVELDATEARLWKAIVGALPPLWLDAAAQEVLTRATAQAAICEALESRLRELRAEERQDLDAIETLAAQHAAASKSLAHLLGVLRATPRARMIPRGASRELAQVPRVRPWETSDSDGEEA